MGKTTKDKRDIYQRLAKERGFRARSAFKLLQINEKFKIFDNVNRAVDLCAAPGSWSQVLRQEIQLNNNINPSDDCYKDDPKIISIDLQEMAPLAGVKILQGDITRLDTASTVIKSFKGNKADIVVCDGAPDVTGFHAIDQWVQSHLLRSELAIASQLLNNNGKFIAKIFRGKHCTSIYTLLNNFFSKIFVTKPASSRSSSYEAFVVCFGFNAEFGIPAGQKILQKENINDKENIINKDKNYNKSLMDTYNIDANDGIFKSDDELINIDDGIIDFIACGDLSQWDSDKIQTEEDIDLHKEQTQLTANLSDDGHVEPINPPYEYAIKDKHNK